MKPSQYHKRAYKAAKKMNEKLKEGPIMGFKHNPDFPKCQSDFLRVRMDRLNEVPKAA